MHHENWLKNWFFATAIENDLLFRRWRPNANTINFLKLPKLGQPVFLFIYRPVTAPNRKFNARAIHFCLVGMESDKRLCRIYDPNENLVHFIRLSDSVEDLSRQSEMDAEESIISNTEVSLHETFCAQHLSFAANGKFKDPAFLKRFLTESGYVRGTR